MSFSALLRRSVVALTTAVAATAVGSPMRVVYAGSSSNQVVANDEQQAQRVGNELRTERRWAEAIEHYDKSLKTWPDNESFQSGLRQSKRHFSIDRRYADKSFQDRLLPLSQLDSMTYFDDMLEKVRRYYVDTVTPTNVLAHGTESLYFALANEKFLHRNLPNVEPARVSKVRRTLRETYWNKQVTSHDQARRTVAELCDLTQRELGLAPAAVVMEFVFGGCNSLDDYSSYLTPGKLDDLYNNIDGEFVGIGIEMKEESGKGLLLMNVLSDSPAEEAGIKVKDILLSINDRTVETRAQLSSVLRQLPPDSQITIRLKRENEYKTVKAKLVPLATDPQQLMSKLLQRLEAWKSQLKTLPNTDPKRETLEAKVVTMDAVMRSLLSQPAPPEVKLSAYYGLEVQLMTEALLQHFAASHGVLVATVNEKAPAAQTSLQAGDVITHVGEKKVTDLMTLLQAIDTAAAKAKLTVIRRRTAQTLPLVR